MDKAAQADGGGLWPGDLLAANRPKAMTPLCVRANLPGRVVVATLPADKRRQAHQDMIDDPLCLLHDAHCFYSATLW